MRELFPCYHGYMRSCEKLHAAIPSALCDAKKYDSLLYHFHGVKVIHINQMPKTMKGLKDEVKRLLEENALLKQQIQKLKAKKS